MVLMPWSTTYQDAPRTVVQALKRVSLKLKLIRKPTPLGQELVNAFESDHRTVSDRPT